MKKSASFLPVLFSFCVLVNAFANDPKNPIENSVKTASELSSLSIATIPVTPGNLSNVLTSVEMSTMQSLKLSGSIDARDFKTMRDSMPLLETLDLSLVNIVSYSGTEGPRAIDTYYPENTIPRNAFFVSTENTKLTTVIQPENLIGIGRSAYNLCSGLTNINWPSGLKSIGYAAFYNCRSLKSIQIPSGVTAIDTMTFRHCIGLTSVTIPSTVKEIRYASFYECFELESLTIEPNSTLTHIGDFVFWFCSKLTGFVMPPTINHIGKYAFLGTKVELDIPASNNYYTTLNGVLYDKMRTTLIYCPAIKTGLMDVPPTVNTIEVDAFYNCSGLDSIFLPSSLKFIEDWAFENCTGLQSLTIPSSVTEIRSYAFYNCSGLKTFVVNSVAPIDLCNADSVFNYINMSTCTLYVPSGLKPLYQAADKWKDFVHIVEFSDAMSVTPGSLSSILTKEQQAITKRLNLVGSIDARDFKTMRDNMPLLEYVDLSATSIVAYTGMDGTNEGVQYDYIADMTPFKAFFKADGSIPLNTIILPNDLKIVGRSSFNKCYKLRSVHIPNSVITLERLAFYSCNSIDNIIIPSSVTYIGYGVFIGCGFQRIDIPNGVKILGDFAFQSCTNLEHVTLPASLDSIGFCTFTFNDALKSFDVEPSNTKFSSLDGVLFDKAQKTLITFPNRKSNSYRVPDGVEVIDTAAFEGCRNLFALELPLSLKRICLEAFYECNNLISIEIPASVTAIEALTFYNCSNLKTINARPIIPVDLTDSGSSLAGVDRNVCILRVPAGTKSAYQAANKWGTFNIAEDLSKQVSIVAGGLLTSMNSDELNLVTHLKITGSMDARDFKTIRDLMPVIAELDLKDASIVAYSGPDGTLPDWFQYQANAIPWEAFFFRDWVHMKSWLTKVEIPTSVTSIGGTAFTNTGLKSFNLHEGITEVNEWAFYRTQLSTLSLPASLTSVHDNAFGAILGLQSFNVASGNPNFLTIEGCLFDKSGEKLYYWPNAKSNVAIIPLGTLSIEQRAFDGCDFINFIYIPTTVNNLYATAFSWAGHLLKFEVAGDNPSYTSMDGVLYDKAVKTLIAYPNLKTTNFEIPDGINDIGPFAFCGCWNLREVYIPTSVTRISNNAFRSCMNLNKIEFPLSVNVIEHEAFMDCSNLKSITANWLYPVNLSSADHVFSGVDKANCVLKVPAGAAMNYRLAMQWNEFNLIDEVQNVKYLVNVPEGTKACYIAGEMNGWNMQPMTKIGKNEYTTLLMAHMSDNYKYFSGADWMYEEVDATGNTNYERRYHILDTVIGWMNVYEPWIPYSPWKIDTEVSMSYGKIQFVSPMEGWVANGNDNGLLHSVNGGDTWEKVVPFPDEQSGSFSDPAVTMDWVSPTHGWVMKTLMTNSDMDGSNGAVLYSTTNGGNSWNKKALPKSSETITYSTSDLQGVWQVHEIIEKNPENSESMESSWGHSKMTITADGTCTMSDVYLSSDTWNPEGAFGMSVLPNGTVRIEDIDFDGFMSSDRNTVIFTLTDVHGEHEFGVMQRQVPGTVYSTADLAGTWQMNLLYFNNSATPKVDEGWMNALTTIDAGGNSVWDMLYDDGSTKSETGKFDISGDGFVSVTGLGWHGFMNAEKTAIYSALTDDDSTTFDMCVMQKVNPAVTYSTSDLKGIWRMHDILFAKSSIVGEQGYITNLGFYLNENGEGQIGSGEDGENGDESANVQLQISNSGIVTEASGGVRGFMNAEKNTIVYTRTQDNGYALGVFQKDSTYNGDMGLQVQFADENNGWASTYNMLSSEIALYRSTNGGSDWNQVSGFVPYGFFDFVDANNGWAVSAYPTDTSTAAAWSIVHSIDGGLNWTTQYFGSYDSDIELNAIQFTDLNHGWATGNHGMILKTVDGGQHWTSVTNSGRTMESNSKALYFLDANTGWITVDHNIDQGLSILHTKDGGDSWTEQNTNLSNGSLFSLFYWDETHGWFTGEIYNDQFGNHIYEGVIGTLKDGAIKLGGLVSNQELLIYPNPVKEGFNIRSLEPGSMVSIFNLNGATVLKQRAEGDSYFDVRDLKKGMYLVRITSSKGVVNKKMIKM